MKEFSCSDMGYDCDYKVTGDNDQMMMDQIASHGKEKHGLSEITQEMKDKILSKFRTSSQSVTAWSNACCSRRAVCR